MGAQTVAKTSVRRNDDIEIRFKSYKYPVTDEPLGKNVIENVDNQIVSIEIFTSFFHSIVVIGLQHKGATKKTNGEVQKVERIVHYFLK